MKSINGTPMGDSSERAEANVVIYRLAAAAFGHPVPELHEAFADGRFHDAFNSAWRSITGRDWPRSPASESFTDLEAGYIDMFLHGRRGQPRVHLLAGDHETLRGGVTRPVFMLNVQAFYRHFDLQAATEDEGRTEEPDHVATMLEFMAVLHHLEARAIERGNDPSAYRRAQRDFLHRYLVPLMEALYQGVSAERHGQLDANLLRLIEDLPQRLRQQLAELEVRIGPCADLATGSSERQHNLAQNLWS